MSKISENITPEIAAHVLFHFGQGGWPPSNFKAQLVQLIAVADAINRPLLACGFPGYVEAFEMAQYTETGTAELLALIEDDS